MERLSDARVARVLRFTMDWLLNPFNYDFMRQALKAGVLMDDILLPAVGTFLMVQQMALLGDMVAHAGLAIANFL